MLEQNILFNNIFSSSKIVGAIKVEVEGHFLLFLNGAAGSFRGQSSLLLTSTSRHNINKLIKHKIFTMKFSFQKFKNMRDSTNG